ncbi:MAG: SH3 domain-containing protein [Clostridia bacterium]|nr:SH3 domain-containing protein [Clostridia bacterium]
MKRFLVALLAVMLTMTAVLPSVSSAYAASKKKVVYILNIDNDGVRVRSTPGGGDNVMTSLKKGTKLFYLGKSGSWYKVCSEYGLTSGYVYKGYASYYGAVALDSIFQCDGRTRVYSRPSTTSRRVTTLKDDQFVIVYAVSGDWAYVHTISGKKGYVKISQLDDI